MSDKVKPKNEKRPFFSTLASETIYYGNIERQSLKIHRKTKVLPATPKTSDNSNGRSLAPTPPAMPESKSAARKGNVDLIGNAGVIEIPDDAGLPDAYEFEILRLRRRVDELECTVKDRDRRNVRAIAMLEDELQMWRTFLHDHVSESHSEIQRRVARIESTLMVLKDIGGQVYPEMQLPERWKKTER